MVDSSQSHGPSLQHLQDVPWPPGTTQEMIDTFPRLNAREGDIYIVSYPKAGKVYIVKLHVKGCFFCSPTGQNRQIANGVCYFEGLLLQI